MVQLRRTSHCGWFISIHVMVNSLKLHIEKQVYERICVPSINFDTKLQNKSVNVPLIQFYQIPGTALLVSTFLCANLLYLTWILHLDTSPVTFVLYPANFLRSNFVTQQVDVCRNLFCFTGLRNFCVRNLIFQFPVLVGFLLISFWDLWSDSHTHLVSGICWTI